MIYYFYLLENIQIYSNFTTRYVKIFLPTEITNNIRILILKIKTAAIHRRQSFERDFF